MNWIEFSNEKLNALLQNLVAEGRLAQDLGIDASPAQIVGASRELLMDVILNSLPLSRITDSSDLVLHAEGPSVRMEMPTLSAFNWLSSSAEKALRQLSGGLFDLQDRNAKSLAKALDLRLTGMAPGSLYLGFALIDPEPDLIQTADEPVFARLRGAMRQLPTVTNAIGDEELSREVWELLPDAAERDVTLGALLGMAPTGQRGIHSVDISSPGTPQATLSQRERVVLRDALKRPSLANKRRGRFVGEVREIDLDAGRFHLRGVANIGSIRCVVRNINRQQAKELIGEFVAVSGEYESDKDGRPRLVLVEDMEALPSASQAGLGFSDPEEN